MNYRDICATVFGAFFAYETNKLVLIRSYKVGIMFRLIQSLIIAYIIGYAIVYQKGYQEFDEPNSIMVSKVKGVAFSNRSDLNPLYRRIWDGSDYVVPPQENNAFFVMTNAIITAQQTENQCPESPVYANALCNDSTHCTEGATTEHGIMTGKCIPYNNTSTNTCEIFSWCPVEYDVLPSPQVPLIPAVENFTVLIKNFVEFSKFGVKFRNIVDQVNNSSYLSRCTYNPKTDPLCPIFALGEIVKLAGANFTQAATNGSVFSITISWDCNLDYSYSYCTPNYRFYRLDQEAATIAPGWNFRYANYYRENGTAMRDLYKAYGILFVVTVRGRAGKFSMVPLLLNIGSGLALLSLATIICDMIILYILKNRKYYAEKKYLRLEEDGLLTGPRATGVTGGDDLEQVISHRRQDHHENEIDSD